MDMNKRERLKMFAAGVLTGLILLTGLGFANLGEVTALLAPVRYLIRGEEVSPSDRPHYYFNGQSYVPASLIHAGTTYLPLRFVAESLGLKVDWNQDTGTISIREKPMLDPAPEYPKDISWTNLEKNRAPAELAALLDYSLATELAQSYTLAGNTYLILTRGPCPTGGYGVVIRQVLESEDEVLVKVEYKDPPAEAIVTQAITYPYALARMEETDKPIRFQDQDGIYLPQLYGLERMESITAESKAIKLFTPTKGDNDLTVRGMARVFEATVSWRLVAEDKKELKSGFTTAARGGPDWGYFSFVIEKEWLGRGPKLQVYEESAKDGSAVNVVEIPLDQYASLAYP